MENIFNMCFQICNEEYVLFLIRIDHLLLRSLPERIPKVSIRNSAYTFKKYYMKQTFAGGTQFVSYFADGCGGYRNIDAMDQRYSTAVKVCFPFI